MQNEVEFAGWAEVTGDASRGAICRVRDRDEVVFSTVVRLSRSLTTTAGIDAAEIDTVLPQRAERLVAGRLRSERTWAEQHRGQKDVVWTLTADDAALWWQACNEALVQAVETDDPDPAGRRVRRGVQVHAYDADKGEAIHPITNGSYVVHADLPWSNFAGQRCTECKELLAKR